MDVYARRGGRSDHSDRLLSVPSDLPAAPSGRASDVIGNRFLLLPSARSPPPAATHDHDCQVPWASALAERTCADEGWLLPLVPLDGYHPGDAPLPA